MLQSGNASLTNRGRVSRYTPDATAYDHRTSGARSSVSTLKELACTYLFGAQLPTTSTVSLTYSPSTICRVRTSSRTITTTQAIVRSTPGWLWSMADSPPTCAYSTAASTYRESHFTLLASAM